MNRREPAAGSRNIAMLDQRLPGIDGVEVSSGSQASAPNPLRAPMPRTAAEHTPFPWEELSALAGEPFEPQTRAPSTDIALMSSWVGPWRA